jgi:hypothetical protein
MAGGMNNPKMIVAPEESLIFQHRVLVYIPGEQGAVGHSISHHMT